MDRKKFLWPEPWRIIIFLILLIVSFWIPFLDLHYWTRPSFNYGIQILNIIVYYLIACIISYTLKKGK